jgi:hypothetical protein
MPCIRFGGGILQALVCLNVSWQDLQRVEGSVMMAAETIIRHLPFPGLPT